jgi:hypothetical protein
VQGAQEQEGTAVWPTDIQEIDPCTGVPFFESILLADIHILNAAIEFLDLLGKLAPSASFHNTCSDPHQGKILKGALSALQLVMITIWI